MIKQRMLNGAFTMAPILIGLVPFALTTGIYGTEANLPIWQTVTMSVFIFAGASQVAVTGLLEQAAPISIIILTAFLINLRFLVYSAAVTKHIEQAPKGMKPLLAYLLVDQIFILLSAGDKKADKTYEYLGAGIVCWFSWQLSVFLGAHFGNIIPESLSLKFSLPIMFLFFGVSLLKKPIHIICAITTIISIVVLYPIMPLGSGLLTSILIGALSGLVFKRVSPL